MRDLEPAEATPATDDLDAAAGHLLAIHNSLQHHQEQRDFDQNVARARGVVQELQERLDAAKEDLRLTMAKHDATERIDRLLAQEEAAKHKFLDLWCAAPPPKKKTYDLPGGRVQLRESRGISIHNHEAVAKALLDKDLLAAAQARITIDNKFALPLVERGVLPGASLRVKHTVAFLAPKDDMQYGGGSGPC